jgi:hypothetical protein
MKKSTKPSAGSRTTPRGSLRRSAKEAAVAYRLVKEMKEMGVPFFKVHGSAFQARGVPDYVVPLFGLECKRPVGGRVAPIQRWWIERINGMGGYANVIQSEEDISRAVRKMRSLLNVLRVMG